MLLELREEVVRSETDAGKADAVEALGKLEGIERGGAEELERMRRPTSFAQVRPLDQAHAGIDRGGEDSRHVRGRDDPRQAGIAPPHPAPPSLHRYDVEIAVQGERSSEVPRQVARGPSVPCRERKHPDEAPVLLLADIAFS